jgi:hypothetical protein
MATKSLCRCAWAELTLAVENRNLPGCGFSLSAFIDLKQKISE